jgi:hypothetical protein
MKLPSIGSALLHQYADEQIDVLRIRLWNARKVTAVLSDFYSTERVLAKWALDSGCSAVRFEVTFVDAYVLQGCHEFFRKGKRTCTFSTHLRRMMKCLGDAEGVAPLPPSGDVSRYGIPAY